MVTQFHMPDDEKDYLIQQTHADMMRAEKKLRDALQRGQGVIEHVWSYNTRAWATCVSAADIDGDGAYEILVGLRDGQVFALTKNKALKWASEVSHDGNGIETIVALPRRGDEKSVHVIAGSRKGIVYGLNYLGAPKATCSLQGEVRHMFINPEQPGEVIVGCDDHSIYFLDSQTLQPVRDKFSTQGSIRCVFSYDIDGDGQNEIFAASNDFNIYVLDSNGHRKSHISTKGERVYALFVAPLEKGEVTLLAGAGNKKLLAWVPSEMRTGQPLTFREKQLPLLRENTFESPIRSLFVTDVNRDDFSEILAATENRNLYILDRSGNTLWKHPGGQSISTLFALDIDRDGATELLLGMEDNCVQMLRIDLNRQDNTLYEQIFNLYKNFSHKERQLLYHLVEPQKHIPHYHHMEKNRADLLIAQRKYEDALTLLLELRRQSFQHLWSEPIDCEGSIRAIDSGNYLRDPEGELVVGTDNGHIEIIDIKPSSGNKTLAKAMSKGVYRIASLINPDPKGFDRILVALDDHRVCIMDHRGTIQREVPLQSEKGLPSTLYVHKEYQQRERDAGSEIIVGTTDGRICIYDSSFLQLITSFETEQEVRMLCTTTYGDSYPEIIVGSEDCSVYVLSYEGLLKWRYLTPQRVLAVEIADINNDGRIKILVGCEDGIMYILDSEGDLQGTYNAESRITAIHAQDLHQPGLHPDGIVEIVVAADRKLILLQALDLQQIIKQIDECWQASQEIFNDDDARNFILNYAGHKNTNIHILAVAKLAGTSDPNYLDHVKDNLDLIRKVLQDKSLEVRLELARIAVNLERTHGEHAETRQMVRTIFQELAADTEVEVQLTFVERLPKLKDSNLCFEYLERLTHDENVLVRRAVIRKLNVLMKDHPDKAFSLLLKLAKDESYEQHEVLSGDARVWIYQEVGRSLAHYFSLHQDRLFQSIQELAAQGCSLQVIEQISYSSSDAELRDLFGTLAQFVQLPTLSDENERNTLLDHLLDKVVIALHAISQRGVHDSMGILQIYRELRQLFRVKKVDDIEQYQWIGDQDLIEQISYTASVSAMFTDLTCVIQYIRRYRKRQVLAERLTALIQAYDHLKKLLVQTSQSEAKHVHTSNNVGHPQLLIHAPEDHIFLYIIKRWMDVVFAEIEKIRGKAELRTELKHTNAWLEELVVLSLQITNVEHCPAECVHIQLEESPDFEIKGNAAVTIDEVGETRPAIAEFTIHPLSPTVHCVFQIAYTDAAGFQTRPFADTMELQRNKEPFRHIPDHYRVGMPLQAGELDRKLFFGRKYDISTLLEKLTRTDANSLIIFYGQRRSGKTSLLNRLEDDILAMHQHIPVQIDLHAMALTESIAQLLKEITQVISTSLEKRVIHPPLYEKLVLHNSPAAAFSIFLENVLEQLAPRRLILLIDEFEVLQEQMERGCLPHSFFQYLRSLLQHKQGVSFLLAGAPAIHHLTEWYMSAFFNIAYAHKISKFESEEAKELITKPVIDYLKYDDLALQKLHQLTDDQPYLIHLMGTLLIEHCNKKEKNYVTVNDVNVVADQVIHTQGNHFQWIWNQVRGAPMARLVLSILAQGDEEERFSFGGIHTALEDLSCHSQKADLLNILNKLVDEEFIQEEKIDERPESFQYRIPVGLTRAWLRTIKPLEWTESELPSVHDNPIEV